MSFGANAFQHVPSLRDRIMPPETSPMRFSYDRFAELDEQARIEAWPPGWRMSHEDREANRREVLGDRLDRDLWVFAYGSLIWNPAVYFDEIRRATLIGWSRRFCMNLTSGRDTYDCPGLMAALDEGGRCDAVAFRIPARLVDQETELMWMREMFAGSYRPVFLDVTTPQGDIEALTFVMDRDNERYCPSVGLQEAAKRIATAEGNLGPNFEYLESLMEHLDELGIRDVGLEALYRQACDVRASTKKS